MKILVVDDEHEVSELIAEMLEIKDHDVLKAGDVKEAMDVLCEETVDLIITDLRMPKVNGKYFVELVKTRYPNLPVIVLSGYVESRSELISLGTSKILTKPIVNDELIDAVDEFTGASS